MDIISAYQAINKSTLDVARSINVLKSPKVEAKREYVRLVENPFVLTQDTKRTCEVVTAHELRQYKAKFNTISLEDNIEVWLDDLMSIDKGEEDVCYY